MFIDVHAHVYRKPWPLENGKNSFCNMEELIKRHDELNIKQAALLPIIGPEIYAPQSNEEILDIAEQSGGRFFPFCNIDPRALTNSPDAPLDYLLRYYRDLGCKGVGEVMPNLPILDPRVQNLFKHIEAVGFAFIFDITGYLNECYGFYDDPGLPQLERSLQRFPNLKFLGHGPGFWSEIARLETPADRWRYGYYPVQEEGVVPKLMRRYPNLYAELSGGSGYNGLSRDPAYAVKFLNEFPDRCIYATDICAPDMPLPMANFLLTLRKENKISESVFQKIARENAIRVFNLKGS
jgi:predicted TIM-barrel fold metal-dependent hydrolase